MKKSWKLKKPKKKAKIYPDRERVMVAVVEQTRLYDVWQVAFVDAADGQYYSDNSAFEFHLNLIVKKFKDKF